MIYGIGISLAFHYADPISGKTVNPEDLVFDYNKRPLIKTGTREFKISIHVRYKGFRTAFGMGMNAPGGSSINPVASATGFFQTGLTRLEYQYSKILRYKKTKRYSGAKLYWG